MMTEKDVVKANIVAGFEKCGLFPVNSERPKSKLPDSTVAKTTAAEASSEVMIDILQEMRGFKNIPEKSRLKRCDVAPGKSITAEDILVKERPEAKKQKREGQGKKTAKKVKIIQNKDKPTPQTSSNKENIVTPQETSMETATHQAEVCSPEITSLVADTTIVEHMAKKKLPFRTRKSSDSSTTVSDLMSLHSDSDIVNTVQSDDSEEEAPIKLNNDRPRNIIKSTKRTYGFQDPGPSTSKGPEKTTKTILLDTGNEEKTYELNDTVLVRYFNKTWKYYVGVIEKMIEHC